MAMLSIIDNAPEAQPGRFPPCLFPSSRLTSTGTKTGNDSSAGRGAVELLLPQQWNVIELSLANLGISLPSVLKVAWTLTLRCFVPVDTICFGYHDQAITSNRMNLAASVEGARSLSNQLLYIIRLDGGQLLQAFLQQFESGRKSLVVTAPTGYEIRVVAEKPSRRFCNTTMHYHESEELETKLRSNLDMDLTMDIMKNSSGQICTRLEFWLSHTSEDMAISVLHTFQHIFSQIVKAPNSLRLQDVDVCSDQDRQMIQKLTKTISPTVNCCVHDVILNQCRLYPDRIAVCSRDESITYRELDDLSSRLGHYLVELGVGPETFVLSCFEKSIWAIVTRLAILRAGGAYISIHASNPPFYIDSIIRRTNSQILVSDSAYADQFRHLVPTLVEVSPEWLRSLPVGHKSPVCKTVRGENACLVLFTSGSTGQPKGIIQAHQSYATAIRDYAINLKLGTHTRFFQFDDYAFDISNLEFMAPLFIGGCCCVPGPMKTAQDLADNIVDLQANIIFLTPTVAVKLDPSDVPCLELLCVGGEPLPKDLIVKFANSSTKLINQYGMGEVAICCAYNDQIHLGGGGNVGRPGSGAIWVVDVSSPEKLMPIGAVGELLMEGPHLSRRYLDNASAFRHRTEAVFLEEAPQWMAGIHPERSSARLYRSGDLGRWNHNGTLDYIGRRDTILKMDGCRIDAVEVEHMAKKALSPKDSIIVDLLGIIDGLEDPVLTAFLYIDDHPASTAPAPKGEPLLQNTTDDPFVADKVAHIKMSIAQTLPQFMIPTVFLLTTWMPRTASNKTDRKKIHMVGQKYYLADREKRHSCPSHIKRPHLLPM